MNSWECLLNMCVQAVLRTNQRVMVLQTVISKFFFQPPVIRNQLIGKMQETLEYVIHNPQQSQDETTQF